MGCVSHVSGWGFWDGWDECALGEDEVRAAGVEKQREAGPRDGGMSRARGLE